MANSCYRVLPGVAVLLVVCILWVFSAEVATLLIKDTSPLPSQTKNGDQEKQQQNAPKNTMKTGAYFLTFFKSALFSLYLWIVLAIHVFRNGCSFFGAGNDSAVLELSESHYVPLKSADCRYDSDDYTDEDVVYDVSPESKSSLLKNDYGNTSTSSLERRRVRFKNLAEVRHLIKSNPSSSPGSSDATKSPPSPMQSSLMNLSRKTGFKEHAYLAVQCVTLWFFANYFYALALKFTEAGMANILSLTSSVFILFFGVILPSSPSDRVTLTKLVAVSLMISGAVLAGVADSSLEATPLGLAFALLSAFLYAAYLTLIKRQCPHQSTTGVLSLLGFMGLYCLLFFWPAFIILHTLGIEQFHIPTDKNVLILLTTSSLIGSVVADALWLIGAYMTSSLTATISLSMTIPFTILADWFFRNVNVGLMEFMAMLPILFGFTLGALTSQWEHWDPIWVFVKKCFSPCHVKRAIQKSRLLCSRSAAASSHQEDTQECSLLSAVDEGDNSAMSL